MSGELFFASLFISVSFVRDDVDRANPRTLHDVFKFLTLHTSFAGECEDLISVCLAILKYLKEFELYLKNDVLQNDGLLVKSYMNGCII